MVVDHTGSLAGMSRHDYLPFGEEVAADPTWRTATRGYGAPDGLRQQFTSQQRDAETGLDYFNARYYSKGQGRFSSPDPFAGSAHATDPQTLNRYSYVTNNPLNASDPSGMAAAYAMVRPPSSAFGDPFANHEDFTAEDEARYEANLQATMEAVAEADAINGMLAAGTDDNATAESAPSHEGDGLEAHEMMHAGDAGVSPQEPTVPEKSQLLTFGQSKVVDKAVQIALQKLQDVNSPCAIYIGFVNGGMAANPYDVLKNKLKFVYDSNLSGAQRRDADPPYYVRLGRDFFNDYNVPGVHADARNSISLFSPKDLPPASKFTNDMARAVIIFHEERHVITGQGFDKGQHDATFNENILKWCFGFNK